MDNVTKILLKHFPVRYDSSHDNLPLMCSKVKRDEFGKVFAECSFTKGAEIGVRVGKFSEILCKANPPLELWCIDPWFPYGNKYSEERQDRYYEETKTRLAPCNVHILRKTSIEALVDIPDRFLDFVYIDGDHTFDCVCPDLINWSKKVKKGGIVALHDYYHFHLSGIVEAVDAYTHCHKIDPWYVTKELEPTAYWINP